MVVIKNPLIKEQRDALGAARKNAGGMSTGSGVKPDDPND
jgi:hypothetical protein